MAGRADPMMSEVTATGPTARCLDEPNAAYTMTCTNAPYNPYSCGRPARRAYDMPCGTTRAATEAPARRSYIKSLRML